MIVRMRWWWWHRRVRVMSSERSRRIMPMRGRSVVRRRHRRAFSLTLVTTAVRTHTLSRRRRRVVRVTVHGVRWKRRVWLRPVQRAPSLPIVRWRSTVGMHACIWLLRWHSSERLHQLHLLESCFGQFLLAREQERVSFPQLSVASCKTIACHMRTYLSSVLGELPLDCRVPVILDVVI